jgi:hypothetical protein
MILDDDWPCSPCRFPAVHTALQRKDRKTCHLLRSKLLELRSGLDSIPVSHPKIYGPRLAARLGFHFFRGLLIKEIIIKEITE